MMRILIAGMALLAAVVLCPWLSAGARKAVVKADVANGRNGFLVEKIQDLNLTAEQEKRIEDIQKECKPKVQEAAHAVTALVQEEVGKIHAVLSPEQNRRLRAFREERRESRIEGVAQLFAHVNELELTNAEMAQIGSIRREYRPKIAKALYTLRGVFTAEQNKARDAGMKAGKKHCEILASLKLTGAQKEKVATVCQEVRNLVREEMEKIMDVLNATQQEKLAEFKNERADQIGDRLAARIVHFRSLNLTREQRTKIENIRKEYRPKIQAAGNAFRVAVRAELGRVVGVIKT